MESRLKHRIFVFSLLVWTVICPSGTQQTHSLHEQFLNPRTICRKIQRMFPLSPEVKQKINELKEAGVLVPVIPSKEDDLFLLLIKGLIQSFTVAYFLAL